MADGLFYVDTREPHFVSNLGAVTMTTTAKAMYAAANFPTALARPSLSPE